MTEKKALLERNIIPSEARDKAIKLLETFEGCRLKAYKCPAGVWTIGYGHTEGVKEGDTITKEKAREILGQDLLAYHNQLVPLVYVPVTKSMHAALLSFIYNLGAGTCKKSTLFKELNARNYQAAANGFSQYVFAGGKKLDGLVSRRNAERQMFLKDGI